LRMDDGLLIARRLEVVGVGGRSAGVGDSGPVGVGGRVAELADIWMRTVGGNEWFEWGTHSTSNGKS
jgi:hypothetical protein